MNGTGGFSGEGRAMNSRQQAPPKTANPQWISVTVRAETPERWAT